MKNKLFYAVLALVALLGTSCSKTDEMPEPTGNAQTTWVTYEMTVGKADANDVYDIEYISINGLQTVKNHTGNFLVRVPVMTYNEEGTTYTRSMISFKAKRSDDGTAPLINAGMKITTDNGFVIAETYQDPDGCGYTERMVNEVRPLSWFNVK